jgi:uncharacterized membrane protein
MVMIYSILFEKTPLKFFIQSFWRDEAFSYLLSKKNIIEIIFLTAKDFNPPLYYFLIHFWMKIFGTSEIALRTPSFIFYWLTIYVVYLILSEILKIERKRSFIYLILFVINPVLTYYAFEARMYTMLAFLASLSFYFFLKKNHKYYLFATICGLYTHYFMIFVVITQLIYYLLFEKVKKDSLVILKRIGLTLAVFAPWALFIITQKGIVSQAFWIKSMTRKTIFNLFGSIYTGYEKGFKFYDQSITWLSPAIIAFILVGLSRIRKETTEKKRLFYFLLFWVTVPLFLVIIVSFFKPLLLTRYLIFVGVGLLILIVFILENMNSLLRAIIFTILVLMTLNYQKLQIRHREKYDMRQVVGEIKKLAKKNDLIYVVNDLDFHTVQYYFDENRVYIYNKKYEEIPNFIGKILIPEKQTTFILPRYPQKAFIINFDKSYDIQAVY